MKYYVTTPIYYVTAKPHIGTAYATTIADIIARWHRLCDDEVFFLTGSDEHGEKIEGASKALGQTPKEMVDELAEKYKSTWKELDISYDKFIRTTDEHHEKVVKEFFKVLYNKGDIYKGYYEGWYCVPDEMFITELQLVNGKCPECGREVKRVKEETYFFRLSKYQNKLLEFYDKNSAFLMPKKRSQEIINRVKAGINDISISREKVKWGVKLPIDEKHTAYVWFDALLNYLSAVEWPSEKYKKIWPPDVHIVGKEINWFHTVIWPSILFSAGIEPPKTVFAHGWWTVDGKKMSKSLGNYIDPIEIKNKYGVDALRYFFVREMPLGDDADFSEAALISRINGELVDDLGNLVYRTLTLAERFDGKIEGKPELDKNIDIEKLKELMNKFDTFSTINEIWNIVRATNKYINDNEAWKLDGEKIGHVLYNLLESLRVISILLIPFMPETAEKIRVQLGTDKQKIDKCKFLPYDGKIKKGKHLFEKVKK
ncbi:MAG: methionine--tRNA ligase [Candidatus Micrarchaeia archaeon]